MRISTRRDALFAQLQTVSRAASTRSAVQALSGVQLAATAERIELRATDMEIGLRVPVEGDVVREGAVVLPGRLLVDVVRALPGAEVSLELRASEQDVEIRSGSATFHIRTLRLEDFPPLPEPEPATRVQVPAAALVETIAKVARAASTDQARPVLTGIMVSATGEELRMVATDSYRLAVKETRLEKALSGAFEANVPARAMQEVQRIATGVGDGELAISQRAGQVVFEADGVVLSSRLIEGQFPNYRQLLPDAFEHELQLAGAEISVPDSCSSCSKASGRSWRWLGNWPSISREDRTTPSASNTTWPARCEIASSPSPMPAAMRWSSCIARAGTLASKAPLSGCSSAVSLTARR